MKIEAKKTVATGGGLKEETALKGGRIAANHNAGVKVKTALKGGRIAFNHNAVVRTFS
jgi:hypothetical protein